MVVKDGSLLLVSWTDGMEYHGVIVFVVVFDDGLHMETIPFVICSFLYVSGGILLIFDALRCYFSLINGWLVSRLLL